ncbi:MAG: metallophosphoesterase family protein [Eubacteriales bacterium]
MGTAMFLLKKTAGKDFLVLNLSDPQLGNDEWEEGGNCRILKKTVGELIERVRPDLITVSGDLSWAGNDRAYDMLADYLDSFSVPWAPVWGNHDNQGGPAYIDSLADRYLSHPYCLYEKGDPALGNGNYVIGIMQNDRIVSAILMMDSHDRLDYTDTDGETRTAWAKLYPEQLDWYRAQIRALEQRGCKDTAVIMHIPIYAYRDASRAAYKPELDLSGITLEQAQGDSVWNEGYEDSVGVQYEGICSFVYDDGVFPVIRGLGSTKYVIAGHDHVNNWMIRYQGVRLVYSLKAGNGCYWNPILNGGTVLRIGDSGIIGAEHEFVDVSDLL